MTIISSVRDLRAWVEERAGDGTPATVVDEMVAAIIQNGRPLWGVDWSAYLDALPDLYELI